MELSEFTADKLMPHMGTIFRFDVGQEMIDLTLTEVKVLVEKHVSPKMKRDQFSLYFQGPENLYIRQGPYPATHETLGGPWPIFIVPMGRRENGSFEFEAVFT